MTILGDMMITASVFPYLSLQRAEVALRVCALRLATLQEAKLFLTLAMHLYDLAKMENLNPPSKFDGVSKKFRRLMRDVCYLYQCRISLFGIAYRQ